MATKQAQATKQQTARAPKVRQVPKGTMPTAQQQQAAALASAPPATMQAGSPAAVALHAQMVAAMPPAVQATIAAVQAATTPQVQGPQAPATPLPANWLATAPSAQASAAVFASYRLPNSLQAKGANLCGGNLPPALQGAKLLPGRPYVARSGHNATWAATCTAMATAAAAQGGVPAVQLLQAGVGAHSIAAFVKRGWLVRAPA